MFPLGVLVPTQAEAQCGSDDTPLNSRRNNRQAGVQKSVPPEPKDATTGKPACKGKNPQNSNTHQPASRRAKGDDDDNSDHDLKGNELTAKGGEQNKSIKLSQTCTYLLVSWFGESVFKDEC